MKFRDLKVEASVIKGKNAYMLQIKDNLSQLVNNLHYNTTLIMVRAMNLFKSHTAGRLQFFLFTLILFSPFHEEVCIGQEADKSSLPLGKWRNERLEFDTRPFDNSLLGHGLLNQSYFDFKNNLWSDNGISFGGYISANVQWGSHPGPAHGISETLLMITWEMLRNPNSSGRLVVGFAHDQTFGHPTTREFANDQQIVETPNDLDTDPEMTFTTLGLFHWEQEWRIESDRGFGLRAGQLYAPSYFGSARYLDDDRRFFMARPIAAAAGAQWVGYNDIGLGMNAIAWKSPWYASVAVMDGKANRQFFDIESIFDGELLYLAEIGFENNVDGPNESAIRITFTHLDVKDGNSPSHGPGQSLMVSGDIRFEGMWAIAGRWSKSYKRLSADYEELLSLGIMWLMPFNRDQDLAGFGFFAGDPSDEIRGLEYGGEFFYRLQLTNAFRVLPDIQYWIRKDESSEKITTWIWGIRSEFEF